MINSSDSLRFTIPCFTSADMFIGHGTYLIRLPTTLGVQPSNAIVSKLIASLESRNLGSVIGVDAGGVSIGFLACFAHTKCWYFVPLALEDTGVHGGDSYTVGLP